MEAPDGSMTWKGVGCSWLYSRTDESVLAERNTLRWKGEKACAHARAHTARRREPRPSMREPLGFQLLVYPYMEGALGFQPPSMEGALGFQLPCMEGALGFQLPCMEGALGFQLPARYRLVDRPRVRRVRELDGGGEERARLGRGGEDVRREHLAISREHRLLLHPPFEAVVGGAGHAREQRGGGGAPRQLPRLAQDGRSAAELVSEERSLAAAAGWAGMGVGG